MLLPPFRGSGPVMNLLGLSPVMAIIVGVRMHRPRSVAPWAFFAVGFLLFWFGDLYTYSYPLLLDRDVPFPSPGDAAYVLVYPVLMAGLLALIWRRSSRGDRGGVIDGLILTVGLSLPQWIALMAPYLHDNELSPLAKLVSIAYPLGDVLLLAAAIRLTLDGGRRAPAFYLLSSSIVLLLATDFVYGLMILHGTYDHQLWLDVGWIGFYLLWGAAALHPSMAQLEQRSPRRDAMLTRFRLALLTCASLAAPAISIVHDIQRRDLDMAIVTGASIALFGLVVVRMAGLVRQQERSLARERMLSSAGAALVGAASRAEILDVAVGSAQSLAGEPATALLCSVGDDDRLELLAAAGDGAPSIAPRALPGPDVGTVVDITPRRGGPKQLIVVAPARPAPIGRGRAARARHPGGAGARQHRADRGDAPAAQRGALRLARPALERSHHGARPRRRDRLPEPVDRARARLHARAGRGPALRGAGRARRPRPARAARRLRRRR